MVHRCLEIINVGCSVPLHRDELVTLVDSIEKIQGACLQRLATIKGKMVPPT